MGLREGTLERLPLEAREYITALQRESEGWRERHAEVREHVEILQTENTILNERLNLLLYRRFARSAESVPEGQGELFIEAEEKTSGTEAGGQEIEIPGHTRSKRGRKPIDENHPRIQIVHEITDEEKHCACGHELQKIGEETSERLLRLPFFNDMTEAEQEWVLEAVLDYDLDRKAT